MSVDHDIQADSLIDSGEISGWREDYSSEPAQVSYGFDFDADEELLEKDSDAVSGKGDSEMSARASGQDAEGFSAYLAAIARTDLLTSEQERSLGKIIRESRLEASRAVGHVPALIGHFVQQYQEVLSNARELTEIVSVPSNAEYESEDTRAVNHTNSHKSTATRKQEVKERMAVVVSRYGKWVDAVSEEGLWSDEARRSRERMRRAFAEVSPSPGMIRELCAVARALNCRVQNLEKRVRDLAPALGQNEAHEALALLARPSNERSTAALAPLGDIAAEPSRLLQRIQADAGTDISTLRESALAAGRAEARYERAWRRMVEANLRLVVAIARNFVRNGVSIEDLVQEGNIGLFRAADKFDYRLGYKFSTYASFWIRQAVMNALTTQGRIMRVPAYMNDHIIRLYGRAGKLQQKLGRDPTVKELSEACELPEATVLKALEAARVPASLDTPLDDRDGPTLHQRTASEVQALERNSLVSELKRVTEELLKPLTDRETMIIRMHFGLGGVEPMTLEQIAQLLGLSRERIRQIEAQALKTLKQLADPDLKDALVD